MPERIQRKRTRGFKMPVGAIYVGRPTKWGNPFVVSDSNSRSWASKAFRDLLEKCGAWHAPAASPGGVIQLVGRREATTVEDVKRELRGKDLACWCPLPKPGEPDICHAAILLEIANS